MEKPQCLSCRGDLPAPADTGRPRSYCSTGCRRAAEFELRRLQRGMEVMDEQIRWCRLGWSGRSPADLPRYEAELQRLEHRLRELLDDQEDDGA